ncbi:hypothetical protein BDR06DRAFT_949171 [Suillus hirtellus]|nr:hypothetical protein BDR06DRAFT_949171 [Suillus hirtellus]
MLNCSEKCYIRPHDGSKREEDPFVLVFCCCGIQLSVPASSYTSAGHCIIPGSTPLHTHCDRLRRDEKIDPIIEL